METTRYKSMFIDFDGSVYEGMAELGIDEFGNVYGYDAYAQGRLWILIGQVDGLILSGKYKEESNPENHGAFAFRLLNDGTLLGKYVGQDYLGVTGDGTYELTRID